MTRKKVTLAYITNDSERRASFKKRKKGLIKKVSELSTLCGVDACAIIYSQFEAEPTVWPSAQGVRAVLARFQNMSTMDQTRKMVNQESFTRQRIKKADDQLRRLRKENERKEIERFMFTHMYESGTLNHFHVADTADLGFVINQMLRDIRAQMEALKKNQKKQQINVVAPPMMTAEELEGFRWNLVSNLGFGELDERLRLDEGMVLPYSYNFNNINGADPSEKKPGNGGNYF